jgi:two-component system cell cycle response regulator
VESPDRTLAQPPLTILVAEDSPVIQAVLCGLLAQWGYKLTVVANGEEAWRVLQGDAPPRLALVDWMMPGLHGPELCRRLRSQDREAYTYVLMLTSRAESADIVQGLDAGADDYLTKPFRAQELRARLRAGERMVRLHEQLLAAREELRERATIDDLTRLLNRASILEALDRELDRADRAGIPLSILVADVDRFRQINESFGHLAGDIVLREFAGRLRSSAPPAAGVGRYGGEEFLVILPGADRAEAGGVAAGIRHTIGDDPFHAGAASFPVTCSIGVAGRAMPYSTDAASLLRSADDALLAAKAEARERVAGALRASAVSFTGSAARA